MLDFYFIADEQLDDSGEHLRYADSIKVEEFEMAQKTGLIEEDANYYTDFRWTSQQVKQKVDLLAHCPFHASTVLDGILSEAKAAGLGLVALAD